ncbi:MAG TPA: DNA-binding protein WhiA [Lachnospiraceae bacterium]|nr:DNA-binding protein WhiA [Lachnospiraceae bacterium]
MSFSSDVKKELSRQLNPARHCCIAEFAALFALTGQVKKFQNGEIYMKIHTENLTVAQKSYILLRKTFRAEVDIMVRSHNLQAGTGNYSIFVFRKQDVINILKAVKIIDEQKKQWGSLSEVSYLIVQNTCCKRAFLRGVFMASGSVSNPEKAYHLEIAVLSEKFARQIREIISSFMIDAKITIRKKYYVVYIKEGSQIVDFLNVTGAHMALMDFENVRIVKDVRNSVNRRVNCETANIDKTVSAAARQIEDIKYIQHNMGFSRLTDGLREIALLRLEYPECPLQELGKLLSKPIGKSGVNHRLRKLSDIAKQMREDAGIY